MKYDFTLSSYERLLGDLSAAGYTSKSFSKIDAGFQGEDSILLLRHDIDFDVDAAVRVAQVDRGAGFTSTFFFLLRTEHYNLFTREASDGVRRILGMGHKLGLHFDCASYPADATVSDLANECGREAHILTSWFGEEIDAVSYHRPNKQVLAGVPELSSPYPNTYLPHYTKAIHYCSDSRGEWRYGHPLDTPAFRNRKPLHLLVHPVWWTETDQPPIDKLRAYIAGQRKRLESSVAANCEVYR